MSTETQRASRSSGAHMRDFTTGNIWQHILAFSWPMFVGNLFQVLYNTVDSFWVGRFIGAEALAAVSVSVPIVFALVALIMGLTMATTTLVAQYRGARDEAQVRRTVANSIVLVSRPEQEWLSRNFDATIEPLDAGDGSAAQRGIARNRRLSSSIPARPYICRFNNFNRLM